MKSQRSAGTKGGARRARAFAHAPSSYTDASRLVAREGPVSLLIDSGLEGERLRLRSDDPSLVLTLPGTVALRSSGASWLVDRASWALLPARAGVTVAIESPTARVVVLEIRPEARARTLVEYAREGMEPAAFGGVTSRARLLPRTRWVEELAHRYVFERGICKKHGSAAALFLETELQKEAYFLTVEAQDERERAPLSAERSPIVARALQVIDASLDRALCTSELARRAGASPRTLERAFRRELGLAPAEYLRKRRLDEARVLLRSARHGVGEIAARVGYRSLPAFSSAYRARFGNAPSADRT